MTTEFTEEELKIIRHNIGCKRSDWDDTYGYVCISHKLYEKLPKWKIPLGFSAGETLPDEISKHTFFVAEASNGKYLVNTEGFSYARYIAFLIVCDNYSEYTDYEFSILKHFNGRKVSDWEYASIYVEYINIPQSLYDKLPKLDVTKMTPYDIIPKEISKKYFYIATKDGKDFLVNTEGYDHARYIAPCDVE